VKSRKSDSDEQKRSPFFKEKINRGDTGELTTKNKKGRQVFFQEKNRGVTPSVTAPGVTHPSYATADDLDFPLRDRYFDDWWTCAATFSLRMRRN